MPKSDGSVVIGVDMNVTEADKKLNKLQQNINKLEQELNEQATDKSAVVAELERAAHAARETEKRVDELKAKLATVDTTLSFDASRMDVSPGEYLEAWEARPQIVEELNQQEAILKTQLQTEEQLAKKAEEYDKKIEKTTASIRRQAAAAGNVAKKTTQASQSTERMKEAADRAARSGETFAKRLASVVRSALVFTVITQALSGFREWMVRVIKANDDARASMAKLKGALLTLAQPIVSVLIPALTAAVNVLTRLITLVASFVSQLFGGTLEQSREAADALYEETDAIESVGGAAKEATKSLAGFDEINRLTTDTAGGGGGAVEGVDLNEAIRPDFSSLDQVGVKAAELEILMEGLLLAVGAILAFTGANVPLGLGLMAAGALGLASTLSENWEQLPRNVRNTLVAVSLVLSGAFLALGALLAFSGANIPLGLGLMAVGALGLAAMLKANWNQLPSSMKNTLSTVAAVVSAAALAIGAVLTFTGASIPLGLGLMAMGAAGLAATLTANWDTIPDEVKGAIAAITIVTGALLLAVGLVLAFSGVKIALGLGLMAAGAVILGTAAFAMWDTMPAQVQDTVTAITMATSALLLAVGMVLAFSGVSVPLGVALMSAGGVMLGTAVALNWGGEIVSLLGGAWSKVKTWYNDNVAPVLTKEYWQTTWSVIKDELTPVVDGIRGLMDTTKGYFQPVVDELQTTFTPVVTWFEDNIFTPLSEDWTAMWNEIKLAGQTMLDETPDWLKEKINDGIVVPFEAMVNAVISGINWLIDRINLISFTVPEWVPDIGGKTIGPNISKVSAVTLPRLAQGAVIPPNREFTAVLGDQKSGYNIEAPEALIRRIVREEAGARGGSQTIVLEVDRRQLGKVVVDLYNMESERVGVRLGGVT